MTKLTTDERFDSKWTPDPNTGCHLWTAHVDRDGYGKFRDGAAKHNVYAHRYALERRLGRPIDRKSVV
jgi:hypothetical protein